MFQKQDLGTLFKMTILFCSSVCVSAPKCFFNVLEM